MDKEAMQKIHKFFWPLYVNYRVQKENNESKLFEKFSEFKPSLDRHSILLMNKIRSHTSLVFFSKST